MQPRSTSSAPSEAEAEARAQPAGVCNANANYFAAAMSEWVVDYSGFAPADEGRREALCTLGNGLFATRGAGPESRADGTHYPGTYAAGVFNRLVSQLGDRQGAHESMVNLPNWLPLTFRAAQGPWFRVESHRMDHYRQSLDLRRGILTRQFTVEDSLGNRTALTERRLVSMASPHLAALQWVLTPQNWSGDLQVQSGIDGSVENRNVTAEASLAGRHLRVVDTGDRDDLIWMEAETVQSHLRVAQAVRTKIGRMQAGDEGRREALPGHDRIDQQLYLQAEQGNTVTIEKTVALFTSRDRAISEPLEAALTEVGMAAGFDELLSAHAQAWGRLWRQFLLQISDGSEQVSRTLLLHIFHVLQTLSPHVVDHDVGVPARGLHGEGYRGHIFWDELFVFPFLNLRMPELTRELLLYRYRRLPAARRAARSMGASGARYPWQSGSDGTEQTPTEFFNPGSGRWMADHSQLQHHVGLAVAYNVWQYYEVTGDRRFLSEYGAEMLFEIARFWASLASRNRATERYEITGVMGPDEFHDGYPESSGKGVDNNAYTNVLVSWLMQRAIGAHGILAGHPEGFDLFESLGLEQGELDEWDEISRKLKIPFHNNGIISQFDRYEDLEEFDWRSYRARYGNIQRLDLLLEAEGDTTNRYKLSKQADVLMLLYVFSAEELQGLLAHLGYDFDTAAIPRIVDYYVSRMSHGSTLCRVATSWVLSRVDRAGSHRAFREAMVSDVADIQGGTTREGIHLGAMAGTIDLVQRCYLGVEPRGNVLQLNPKLPAGLGSIKCSLRWRNQWLNIEASQACLTIRAEQSNTKPARVGLGDSVIGLGPGQTITLP